MSFNLDGWTLQNQLKKKSIKLFSRFFELQKKKTQFQARKVKKSNEHFSLPLTWLPSQRKLKSCQVFT